MTAAALAKLLPSRCTVHLIESEAIGIVGVGEATLPHIRAFNERLGIAEAEFMATTRATFKLGIDFENWGRIGDRYIHPFGTFGRGQGDFGFHQYWLRMRHENVPVAELEDYSMACVMARLNRFELPSADPAKITSTFNYAYQFDATLFAPFLRAHAERLGARRTEGRIVDVLLNGESGDIEAVQLENGERIAGDLFIDCSGFVSLLLGKALGEPFQDWSRWLPADRAVAMPCKTETAVTPYTSAIAMQAGWRWRIPLQHRTGNGYVYSSAFISDADAAEALVGAVEGEPIAQPRVLRFLAGRRERSWVKNCIGVGLASGFLEPLESTSIYLVQGAIAQLIELFPLGAIRSEDRDEYNRLVDVEYDRIRDFLILHYHATTRDDSSFWDHVRTMTIPDSLAEKMELWREAARISKYTQGLFFEASWIAVYVGQGVIPNGWDQRAGSIPLEALEQAVGNLRNKVRQTVRSAPDHSDYLARTRNGAGATAS
jgi:tryptophan halogenase